MRYTVSEDLTKEMDPVFHDEEERIKKIITDMADQQIQDAKDQLKTELNNELYNLYNKDTEK